MSRCLARIGEILGLAESKKILDRKNFVANLQAVYQDNEFIEAINQQTSSDFGGLTSWNQIMLTVHHIILMEAEKSIPKNARGNTAMIFQSACCSLMLRTISLATATQQMSLSSADLMAIIFQIMETNIYESYHDTYINILANNVLSNQMYRLEITPEQWQQILRLCLAMYKHKQPLSKRLILDTVTIATQYGCLQSHLLLDIKAILPFLGKLFQDVALGNEIMVKHVYKLTYTVCQQIAIEKRSALCEFGEKILPSIINLDGCPEKYNLLLVFVQIHHPGGVAPDDDAACAHDWDQWKNMIRGMYASFVRDFKTEKLPINLLKLTCEVFRQIMLDPTHIAEEMSSCSYTRSTQPTKRRRLSLLARKPIDVLMENDIEITWPFIQMLTVLLKKYPNCLQSSDYGTFIQTVTEFVTTSLNHEMIMDSLCELCAVLVKAEKKHFHENNQNECVRICWEKIWDTVLRASSMNQNEKLGHELLQSIIEERGALNPNNFIRLYLTNAIRGSASSVKTLLTFCDYTTMPDELPSNAPTTSKPEISTRISLLRWCLEIPSSKLSSHTSAVQLANLLTALTLSSWHKREYRESRNFYERTNQQKILAIQSLETELFDDRDSRTFNDIERCYLTLEFQENLFDNGEEATTTKHNDEKNLRVIYVQESLDFLVTRLNDFIGDRIDEMDLPNLVIKLSVIASLLSNFAELNVGAADLQISKIVSLFAETFNKILTVLTIMEAKRSGHLLHTIEALEFLYSTRYHPEVSKILVKLSSINYLEFVYNLLSEDDANVEPIMMNENSQNLNLHGKRPRQIPEKLAKLNKDSRRINNAAHTILTYFCCAWISDEMSDVQKRVMKNLMKIDLYGSMRNADLRRALRILKIYGTSEQMKTSREMLTIANNFLRQVFDSRVKDETTVRGVFNVLPHFYQASLQLNCETQTLSEIFITMNKWLEKKCYGPLVYADFINCLARVIRTNPETTLKFEKDDETCPMIGLLVSHVNNPFYTVRLEIVRALYTVFASTHLNGSSKLRLFVKIESAIADLLKESEKEDEGLTKISTALHIYGAIIHADEFLRGRALYSIIKLSALGTVKTSRLKKMLLSVSKDEDDQRRLVESNLHYLLSGWFEANYPLQLFPWILADCDSQEDFSRRHIDTLLMIKLQRREFKHLTILCNNLEVSYEKTIEDSFSSIMALLISMIVGDTSENNESSEYARQMYDRLRSNSGEFEAVKSFNDLLEEKLSEIIVHLVKRFCDEEHFYKIFQRRVCLSTLNPPNFNIQTVRRCLLFLEKILPGEKKNLIEYLVDFPHVLQIVTLALIRNIHDANCTAQKLQAFHQYSYFITEIVLELPKSYFDPMALYIVRDVTHSLLALMKQGTETLSEMACEYFHVFLSGSLPARSAEIKEILSFTVSTLIPIIKSSQLKGAMKILRFLIVDQRQILGDAIKKLDSFPNEESFEEIKQIYNSLKYTNNEIYSLEKEIEHFINTINEKTLSCSHEGLVHINDQLSARKRELRMMYERLESMRGFAEDCASSTLHKLVYKLVQLTRSSDSAISLEAAKCLGEIGPADLTTMILHPEHGYARESCHDQVAMLTLRVINQLVDYLIESNMNLRQASSDALYDIFSTTWGHELMNESLLKDLMIIHNIDNPKLYDYIYPFGRKTRSSKRHVTLYVDRGNWQRCIDLNNDLWRPASYDSYGKWIIEITSRLLDCFGNLYTASLKPVCCESVEFCEILLPRLVNLIKQTDDHLVNDVCISINRFFSHLYESIRDNTDLSIMTPDNSPKDEYSRSYECVRCMINVVNFMRIQSSDNAPMALDYLYIAKAAQYCSAYFTSVLYAELWCETLLQNSGLLQDKIPGSWISAIDSICELKPEAGKLLQDIVREAYLHIGDPDSIYGCGLSHLVNSSYRIQHYVHLRQWDKVMLAQDVELSSGNSSIRGILHTLQQSGLQCLLGRVMNTVDPEMENVDDFMYETAWKLGDWSILEADRGGQKISENSAVLKNLNNSVYHASHYRALKCLRDNDLVGVKYSLQNARSSIIKSLGKTSLECSQTVYPILSQLQMLREIEEFSMRDPESSEELINAWQEENFVDTHDFQYTEPILSQRLVIYQTKNCNGHVKDVTNSALVKTHLDIAEIAEKQGYLPIAARSLHSLAKIKNLSSTARDQLAYQEAFLAWKQNDQDIGRYLLRNLINKPSLKPNLRAKALRVYGNWMAETKSENPQTIIERYYEKSIKTSSGIVEENCNDPKVLTDAQADLAQFADAQYQHIIEFMKSPQYESLVECSKLQHNDDNNRTKTIMAKGKDEMKAMIVYERQVTNDAAELEDIKREKEMYLILATRYYLLTLKNSNDNDLLIFRLVSLWLDNTFNKELNELLHEKLDNVASHKFVILLPQLAPHMSDERNIFTTKINDLMERCAKEHPHHTLPVLLALKNTHKDHEFKPIEKGSQRKENIKSEPRVIAASALIAKLVNSPIRPIIQEMSDLSHALVSLAYFTVKESQTRKNDPSHGIPRNQPIMKIRNYTNTCVPTITMDVRPRGNYEDIIGISEYVSSFELPGGVNAPKKIISIGTDGVRRKELVKGQDDLRQDAVMQQVCTVVNSMLRTSKETKRRKLHIRTYKIVPLSQRSGILEWCENTLPISNVLCDVGKTPGMHTKYYPNDWTVATCRKKLYNVDKLSMDVKLKVFLECCKNLHPAFHHFFMEKYPSAETWFERRLAYVRSVATTSMVGYMLGLGDRHFSNILIDQTTAEVIHIDFGIAFAQGKVLPIPETVPFRLTRDMEVAMGICGVEGVMRRSCEETITVLRDQRKILITLLQVLLYDPLFSWAITPVKTTDDRESGASRRCSAQTTHDRGMKKTNKIAERALLRIEQKLQGTEDGIGSSVSGQVERLIQQARDPANLCRLYSGWQAYL